MPEEKKKDTSKRNAQIRASQWRKSITLTPKEGEILEKQILPLYDCANVSQLVKKIIHGEYTLY